MISTLIVQHAIKHINANNRATCPADIAFNNPDAIDDDFTLTFDDVCDTIETIVDVKSNASRFVVVTFHVDECVTCIAHFDATNNIKTIDDAYSITFECDTHTTLIHKRD